jgi:OOP family OmpA-OmpF porin
LNILAEQNMKIARALWMSSLTALAVAASPMVAAEEPAWYVGFNAGQARAKIDDARIAKGLLSDGFTTTGISDDDRHSGFKVFGGYSFNKYIALEAGYFDLGRFGFTATTLPLGTLRGDIKIKGWNADLVGSWPLGEHFSLFARGGLNYAEARDSFVGTGLVAVLNPEPKKRAANYKFGAGAQFNFNRHVGLRLEAERYRIDDAVGNKGDIDLYSAGLVFKFGKHDEAPPPQPVATPEPVVAPVAALPPPPPPPPPAPLPPPPPVRKRVSFSADSLFDFDKSTIKRAGAHDFNDFVADLRGSRYDVITVTGYTDRIGSSDYNMKLSLRRADAVKAYLVANSKIPADKVTTRGVGASDPVTTPDQCKGNRRTPELIACLQPDRRVEVEVTGSRLEAAPPQK